MDLRSRLKSLQNLLNEKVNQLNQIEALRASLTNEILEIRGKIDLLNELITEKENEGRNKQSNIKEPSGKTD